MIMNRSEKGISYFTVIAMTISQSRWDLFSKMVLIMKQV